MSELSTWEAELKSWFETKFLPALEAEGKALFDTLKTDLGPMILSAAKQFVADIPEVAAGTLTVAQVGASAEALGKTLLSAGIQASAVQVSSALSIALANAAASVSKPAS
jgi:hypothetical protein